MADNIRKPARTRMWKRIAIAMGSISTVVLIVFIVIGLLPHGNDAFTIRIDNPTSKDGQTEDYHFHMTKSGEEGAKDEGTYLRGESLNTMVPTTAKKVEAHLTELRYKNALVGQTNYVATEEGDASKGYALIYTIYLVNDSEDRSQPLKYSVQLDSYVETSDQEYRLIDYFRVLIQTEVVGSNEVQNIYYGRKHTNKNAPFPNSLPNVEDQDREPISTYKREWDTNHITSTWDSVGNNGYCKNFSDDYGEDKPLINAEDLVLQPAQTLRFTYVAYFEGADMDCIGQIPKDSYLLLSLHFGV